MKTLLVLALYVISYNGFAQYDYEVSEQFRFGRPHPDAPEQLKDFEPMIGICNCESTKRKPDGSWNEPEAIIWKWKYIMNGQAVQDETLKPDGSHSGSIRQFKKDSSRWYVHYYASASPAVKLPTWEGNKLENGNIVLYREQKAPNGMDGYFRITFYDISKTGYKWIGEWVDTNEKVTFPTWKIDCKKVN